MLAMYGVRREMRSNSSEPQLDAQPAGDGDQVHDGVGRAADRHIDCNGVFESLAGHDAGRAQIFAHDIDDAAAAHLGHGEAARIGRRYVGATGQRHAQASARLVMVEAVPITVQCPALRAMPPSISDHSSSLRRPVRKRSKSLRPSVPEPRRRSRH